MKMILVCTLPHKFEIYNVNYNVLNLKCYYNATNVYDYKNDIHESHGNHKVTLKSSAM